MNRPGVKHPEVKTLWNISKGVAFLRGATEVPLVVAMRLIRFLLPSDWLWLAAGVFLSMTGFGHFLGSCSTWWFLGYTENLTGMSKFLFQCTHVRAYPYMCTHVCINICARVCVCWCVCRCVRVYVCVCMYTCMHLIIYKARLWICINFVGLSSNLRIRVYFTHVRYVRAYWNCVLQMPSNLRNA